MDPAHDPTSGNLLQRLIHGKQRDPATSWITQPVPDPRSSYGESLEPGSWHEGPVSAPYRRRSYGDPLERLTWMDDHLAAQDQRWKNVLLSMDIRDHVSQIAVGIVLAGVVSYVSARVAGPAGLAAVLKAALAVSSGGFVAILVDEWLTAAIAGDIDRARQLFARLAGAIGPAAVRALRRYLANLAGAAEVEEGVVQSYGDRWVRPQLDGAGDRSLLPAGGNRLVPDLFAELRGADGTVYGTPRGGSFEPSERSSSVAHSSEHALVSSSLFQSVEALQDLWPNFSPEGRARAVAAVLGEQLRHSNAFYLVDIRLVEPDAAEGLVFGTWEYRVRISRMRDPKPDWIEFCGWLAGSAVEIKEHWDAMRYAGRDSITAEIARQIFSVEVFDMAQHSPDHWPSREQFARAKQIFELSVLTFELAGSTQRWLQAKSDYEQATVRQRVETKGKALQDARDELDGFRREVMETPNPSQADEAAQWARDHYRVSQKPSPDKTLPAVPRVPPVHGATFQVTDNFVPDLREVQRTSATRTPEERCQDFGDVLTRQLRRWGVPDLSFAVTEYSGLFPGDWAFGIPRRWLERSEITDETLQKIGELLAHDGALAVQRWRIVLYCVHYLGQPQEAGPIHPDVEMAAQLSTKAALTEEERRKTVDILKSVRSPRGKADADYLARAKRALEDVENEMARIGEGTAEWENARERWNNAHLAFSFGYQKFGLRPEENHAQQLAQKVRNLLKTGK